MTELFWWNPASWEMWQQYLVRGIALTILLVTISMIVGRTGRTPYWALLVLMPFFFVPVIGIWAFAYCTWPKIDKSS